MMKILIVDDHAIVRRGLKQILATTEDILVVAEAINAEDMMVVLGKKSIDLILLDLSLPGISGIELIKKLIVNFSTIPIVVLSMYNEAQIVTRALKAGASGYVTKDSEPETLIQAIRKVYAGGKFIDPVLVDAVVFNLDEETNPQQILSERELQVLKRLVSGQSLNDIAQSLFLSPKTVSTHKRRLMQKLSIESNADLVKYGLRHGMT